MTYMLHATGNIVWGRRLIYVYYVEALIAKSHLWSLPGLWFGHMVVSLGLLVTLCFLAAKKGFDHSWRSHGTSTRLLLLFAMWSVISSLMTESPYTNVLWSIVFVLSIYVGIYTVTFFFAADVLSAIRGFTVIIIAWTVLGILLSLTGPGLGSMAPANTRFSGVAANAGDAALNLSLGFLLCVWLIQYSPSPNIYRICSVLLLVTLILTRKRTALLGMMMALPWLMCHFPSLRARRRGLSAMLLGGLAGLTLLLAASHGDGRIDDARVFFRLTEEDDTRTARFMQGLEYIAERPWVGHGPMSKFEDPHAITSSTYDFRRDPHSSVLCLAQYYGIPGAGLFLAHLCSCVWPFFRRGKRPTSVLMQSVCLWAICSLLASEWLMSFGMPGDRLSYILFGFGLASVTRIHHSPLCGDRQPQWQDRRITAYAVG